jgi:hypothetical protein
MVIRISDLYIYDQYSKSKVVKVLRAGRAGGTGCSPSGSWSRGHT